MSTTTTELRQSVPAGTWQLDPVHSTIAFEIEYLVGTFRGEFRDADATLADGALKGTAGVSNVEVKDENLAAHLQSPEFFDAERHPELHFAASEIHAVGDQLSVRGELTIKGVTRPVQLEGTITEPLTDSYGREQIGLKLTTTVDRTEFGLNWNLQLPNGKPALADEVALTADLYFVKEA